MKKVTVFCGARFGTDSIYKEIANKYADWIATNNYTLVYGGGHTGLMGAIADQILKQGGRAIGVIPKSLVDKELAHSQLTELHLVNTMHERKQIMSDLADAFIALPGGFGTLDELCEIITWMQLGFHQKPIALANDNGFFDGFIDFYNQALRKGFISEQDVHSIQVLRRPEDFKWS